MKRAGGSDTLSDQMQRSRPSHTMAASRLPLKFKQLGTAGLALADGMSVALAAARVRTKCNTRPRQEEIQMSTTSDLDSGETSEWNEGVAFTRVNRGRAGKVEYPQGGTPHLEQRDQHPDCRCTFFRYRSRNPGAR